MAEAVLAGVPGPEATGAMRAVLGGDHVEIPGRPVAEPVALGLDLGAQEGTERGEMAKARSRLQFAMTAGAGVVRSASSLAAAGVALGEVVEVWRRSADNSSDPGDELRNLLTVAAALLASATTRTESRGAHTRADFPAPDPAWRCRLVHASAPARG